MKSPDLRIRDRAANELRSVSWGRVYESSLRSSRILVSFTRRALGSAIAA